MVGFYLRKCENYELVLQTGQSWSEKNSPWPSINNTVTIIEINGGWVKYINEYNTPNTLPRLDFVLSYPYKVDSNG